MPGAAVALQIIEDVPLGMIGAQAVADVEMRWSVYDDEDDGYVAQPVVIERCCCMFQRCAVHGGGVGQQSRFHGCKAIEKEGWHRDLGLLVHCAAMFPKALPTILRCR